MQPSVPSEVLPSDIKTLADWIFQQFPPTSPVKVKNILNKPFDFKYCVGEDIETPDQITRNVINRTYQDFHFEAGEEKILMGAAAYLFVDKVARAYTFIENGGESDDKEKKVAAAGLMANVAVLVEAAKLIISKDTVTYSTSNSTPAASQRLQDQSQLIEGATTPNAPVASPAPSNEGDALDNLNKKSINERFIVQPPDKTKGEKSARFFMDGEEVTLEVYNNERKLAVQASAE